MINAANVREFWEVHELEFYWDSQCTLPFPVGLPIASDVITSFPGNTEDMAWDGDLLTRWSANCRVLLGGCSPYTQWVGKNIGDSIPLNKEPVEIFAQVRCTRIYQSPNATRQASQIAIITWENEALDSWQVIYDYGDLAGGAWHTRPAREESLWRIWNMDPMPRPWQVAEVMFFTDLFCEEDKQAFGDSSEREKMILLQMWLYCAECCIGLTQQGWMSNYTGVRAVNILSNCNERAQQLNVLPAEDAMHKGGMRRDSTAFEHSSNP